MTNLGDAERIDSEMEQKVKAYDPIGNFGRSCLVVAALGLVPIAHGASSTKNMTSYNLNRQDELTNPDITQKLSDTYERNVILALRDIVIPGCLITILGSFGYCASTLRRTTKEF